MPLSESLSLVSDQAALIFAWISFGVVFQIINIFGIATNTINIICFTKQGFADSVNVSLLGLSVSDLASLAKMVWTCICFTPTVAGADLPFDPTDICYLTSGMLHFAFTRVSSCITAMITIERCLCITAPLKIKSIITTKRTTVITIFVFIIFIFSGSPVYVVDSLGMKFSASRNKTIYGLVATENREYVEKISFSINNFFIPFCAFVIIVVCTAILSVKLQSSAKWRNEKATSAQIDRVSSRNQKTARMVVMVSSLFIVCFVPVNILVVAVGLTPSLSVNGEQMNVTVIISSFVYLMESVNSSINIFIYYQMSSRYREQICIILGLKRIDLN